MIGEHVSGMESAVPTKGSPRTNIHHGPEPEYGSNLRGWRYDCSPRPNRKQSMFSARANIN